MRKEDKEIIRENADVLLFGAFMTIFCIAVIIKIVAISIN